MASTKQFSNVTAEEFAMFMEQMAWTQLDTGQHLGFDIKTAWRYANGSPIPIPLGLLIRLALRQRLTSKYILALKE